MNIFKVYDENRGPQKKYWTETATTRHIKNKQLKTIEINIKLMDANR